MHIFKSWGFAIRWIWLSFCLGSEGHDSPRMLLWSPFIFYYRHTSTISWCLSIYCKALRIRPFYSVYGPTVSLPSSGKAPDGRVGTVHVVNILSQDWQEEGRGVGNLKLQRVVVQQNFCPFHPKLVTPSRRNSLLKQFSDPLFTRSSRGIFLEHLFSQPWC